MVSDASSARKGVGNRGGFTIVEVVLAVVILALGLLGMGGVTFTVIRQIELADVATERSAALQTVLERLESLPYESVVAGSDSVGIFRISWTVARSPQWKIVEIVTLGPGLETPGGGPPTLGQSVPDTFTYRILRP